MAESSKTGNDEFGEAVRRARERLGMSRRELAETTGLSYPYISQIETGYRMPSTPAMRSLADALGLRPDRLFDAIPPAAGRDAAPARSPASASATRAPVPAPAVPAPAPGPPMPTADAPIPAAPIPAAPMFAPPMTAGPTVAPSPATAGGGRVESSARAANEAVRTTGRGPSDPTTAGAPSESPTGAAIDSASLGAPDELRTESVPNDLMAGAGGWIANRGFQPVAARPVAVRNAPGRDDAVERSAALLTALPTAERLAALTEVQARVIRTVIDDEVRRDVDR